MSRVQCTQATHNHHAWHEQQAVKSYIKLQFTASISAPGASKYGLSTHTQSSFKLRRLPKTLARPSSAGAIICIKRTEVVVLLSGVAGPVQLALSRLLPRLKAAVAGDLHVAQGADELRGQSGLTPADERCCVPFLTVACSYSPISNTRASLPSGTCLQ